MGWEPNSSSWEEVFTSAWILFLPSVEETQQWIAQVLPVIVWFSGLLIASVASLQILRAMIESEKSRKSKALRLLYLVIATMVSAWVFCCSALTLSILDRPFQASMPSFFETAYSKTEAFHIVSAYGLFRRMTGVGTVEHEGQLLSVVARPEIIFEGLDPNENVWREYHFRFKPGDAHVQPRLNVPHQPRLDWQMWFAALGDYQGAPWIVHLAHKLLEGSRDVKALLDESRDPFPQTPPVMIRAQLYYYDYTRWNTTWNRAIPTAKLLADDELKKPGQWWTRTFVKEYLPALERGNPSLLSFVQHHFGSQDDVKGVACLAAVGSWRHRVCRSLENLCTRPLLSATLVASGIMIARLMSHRASGEAAQRLTGASNER
ncbi:hypothetical protein PINS_up004225 [Pythium insidiosum]|nr:hypothetical protein PINS_up004225 [Pythium insidiosum]